MTSNRTQSIDARDNGKFAQLSFRALEFVARVPNATRLSKRYYRCRRGIDGVSAANGIPEARSYPGVSGV